MSAQPIPATEAALVSGEAVELDVRVARAGSRGVALLIDIITQAMLLLILFMLAMLGVQLWAPYADLPLVQGISVVCAVLVLVGYPAGCETLSSGRTLGKMALGLRVVRDDGGPIRFRHALTRALVAVAVEWPGLVLPPFTWCASLITMLAHPRGKRVGDLAAGTLVIHERTPAAWGWVPGMPPALAGWAGTLDLTALDDDLALAVRHFLARGHGLAEPERSRLGQALATEVVAVTAPPPPPGVPGWAYLAAVLAERHRRTAHRLARARSVSDRLWPELSTHRFGGVPFYPPGPPPFHPPFHPPFPPPGTAAQPGGVPVPGGAAGWPSQSWPDPPWRVPAGDGTDPDWTGLRPPPVASALRPVTPRDQP